MMIKMNKKTCKNIFFQQNYSKFALAFSSNTNAKIAQR